MREEISKYIAPGQTFGDITLGNVQAESFINLIEQDAERFCSKDEALDVLSSMRELLSAAALPETMRRLYSTSISFDVEPPPDAVEIGMWLDKNRDEKGYFVKPSIKYRQVTRRVLKNPRLGTMSGMVISEMFRDAVYENVDSEERYIAGYESTTETPFTCVRVFLQPIHQNLSPEECFVAPILSRSHVRMRYKITASFPGFRGLMV